MRKWYSGCFRVFYALFLFIGSTSGALAAKHHASLTPGTDRITTEDMRETNYDVKHLRFNLHLTDTSVYLWGDVTTTAQVVASSMSSYVFELDTSMVIDSAKINGVLTPVSTSDTLRVINLSTAMPAGTLFSAQIFYHGTAPAGSGFFNGLTYSVSSGGTKMVYSISDPYAAKNWWPAKQDVDDKIDSIDMFITVPNGVVDGSNGALVGVDSVTTAGFSTYHWQSHYAIDYYLISVAVARYWQDRSYMHFTGSTDSMLIQNFFIDTATFNPLYLPMFDSIGLILDYYSSLFGRYPFWQEKYGMCYTTLPGGMEHQTMTTIGVPIDWIIAHELMHQWFGDHVTYATWGEMFLSEGFACFSEQLFLEHFCGAPAAKAHRLEYLYSALTSPCGEEYVTDTTGPNTLFYQPTVYHKGQGIITMLRYWAPSDSVFFQTLRVYQQTYSFGNGSVAGLNAIVDSMYGYSMDSFFNQWIYGNGFPEYSVTWNQAGSEVYVQLVQTQSCSSSPKVFYTPLELQLNSATTDTIVWAYNTADTQVFNFYWPDSLTSLTVNPDVLAICKLRSITQDTTLGVNPLKPLVQVGPGVSPNPSSGDWIVKLAPLNAPLLLMDMNGKVLWSGKMQRLATIVPGSGLPPGSYLLKIGNLESVVVIRQ